MWQRERFVRYGEVHMVTQKKKEERNGGRRGDANKQWEKENS